MITGKNVILRAIEKEDLPQLRMWRNNPEFRQYFREYREINSDLQLKWYENTVLKSDNTIMFAIINKEDDTLLGCCGLCYINWVNRNADLSLYIGDKNSYIDDCFAEDACRLLFDYGFGELGLNKIWTEIYDIDEKKYKLYEELGMNVDGKLRQNYFHNGEWHDSFILSILWSEWRAK